MIILITVAIFMIAISSWILGAKLDLIIEQNQTTIALLQKREAERESEKERK